MIVRAVASILRVRQSEGVDFVISGSPNFSVTGSPKDHAVYDGWPIEY